MSTTFTASNGLKVEGGDAGSAHLTRSDACRVVRLDAWEMAALREFFQHERDEELGRWRSKLHPEWVGYNNGPHAGVLIDERCGAVHDIARSRVYDAIVTVLSTEYFAAHPDPKPWHEAKPGEVWELTTTGVDDRWNPTVFRVSGKPGRLEFHAIEPDYSVTHLGSSATAIIAGRRVWPEPADG